MYENYLNIPVRFKEIRQKDEVSRVDATSSIHNMLHLIITTECGEMRHNPAFGCDLRRFDFENIYNLPKFREELRKSLLNSIQCNESRLSGIRVDLQLEQAEIPFKINNRRIKIRITLNVRGVIEKTNEMFTHQEKFYIGPLSYC
jgi:phage baseplate assembly protein W